MRDSVPAVRQHELALPLAPRDLATALRAGERTSLWLGGAGGPYAGWNDGVELIAVAPRPLSLPVRATPSATGALLARVDRRLRERRATGGTSATGLALVLAYEALDRRPRDESAAEPFAVALEVDRSLCPVGNGRFVLTERFEDSARARSSASEHVERLATSAIAEPPRSARVVGAVRTSLGRDAYRRAVDLVRQHIREGDIYQANLCQLLRAGYRGDPWSFHCELGERARAPRSAFLEVEGFALASFSPELFLRVRPPDRIETWPIKGTRARHADPAADRQAADELIGSEKDRAELLMIVDLERNDLGRVCRTGSVHAREIARLVSFATVHHLIGCIEGRLRAEVRLPELMASTFPGGSITGAPKLRARDILAGLEGIARGWFTGSLLWFGDDGSLDSSILIRSVVFDGRQLRLGAGCGIVADSDPDQEWSECMHKARAPAESLGFAPEEAR